MLTTTKASLRSKLHEAAKRFRGDTAGAAAIEFAFIAPLLITMYLGTMEISQGVEMNKKVGRSASVIGDLIAQNDIIAVADVQDIMKIGKAILQPYNRSIPTVIITAIQIDGALAPKVAWSRKAVGTTYTTPYVVNAGVTVPANLLIANTFLIKVESQLEYLPITSWSINKNKTGGQGAYAAIDMAETYYLRPRIADDVQCTGC